MVESVATKKELGQHWLHDQSVLAAIADAAAVVPGDVILEVGPGLGTLTSELLDRGAYVIAVEFDHDLATSLARRLGNPKNLRVEEEDIRRFRFDRLTPGYKIVANIPYYLTSHLLRILSEHANPPHTAVLLVQKEVAERVCAAPGDMSLLSVAVQTYFDTALDIVVPAILFTPPPKVDSQVLVLQARATPLVPSALIDAYFQVVKAGFSERRKKLRSSLSGGLRIEKSQADTLIATAGISGEIRAQELSLPQWLDLAAAWHNRPSR